MDQYSITSLAQELNVSKDLARLAMDEAEGMLEKARDILQGLIPKYVFVKAKYSSRKSDGRNGLLLLCTEKGAESFLFYKAMVASSRDWLQDIVISRPPELMDRILDGFFKEHKSASLEFESAKLGEDLAKVVGGSTLQFMFDGWDKPKPESSGAPSKNMNNGSTTEKVIEIFETALSEILLQRVAVEVDYDFYTPSQFAPIAAALGIDLAVQKSEETPRDAQEEKPKEVEDKFKLYLKGQFIIDPTGGTLVNDIKVGDFAYCDITDRGEVALAAGRLIGAYKKGLWLPIRGAVVEVLDMAGDRKQYRVQVAQAIFVDVLSFTGFRIRTNAMTARDVVLKAKDSSHGFGAMPLFIAIALVAALIILIIMMR